MRKAVRLTLACVLLACAAAARAQVPAARTPAPLLRPRQLIVVTTRGCDDPRRRPLPVQLPGAEYARLRAAWSLPKPGVGP